MKSSSNSAEKSTSLKEKLGKALQNLSVDLFGMEQRVTKSILAYLQQLAVEENTTMELLFLKILLDHDTLRVYLYFKAKRHRELPVKQLIEVFMSGMPVSTDLEKRTTLKIIKLIITMANKHEVPRNQLQICLAAIAPVVHIEATNFKEVREEIPLKTLINYFQ